MWTHIETSLAIICAAVPALKPLFGKAFPGLSCPKSGVSGSTNDNGASLSTKTKGLDETKAVEVRGGIAVGSDARNSGSGSETELVAFRQDCYTPRGESLA